MKKNLNYYFKSPKLKVPSVIIIIGAIFAIAGVIWASINSNPPYYLILLLLGIAFIFIGLSLVLVKILQTPSDQYIDKHIDRRIEEFTSTKDYTPYIFGHYIITKKELEEEQMEEVQDFYTLRGRDQKVRSSMFSVNIYYLFDRRILVEELTFNILNNFEKTENDVFYYQDIVKINITNTKSESGDKQAKFVINLPMGESFSDVISNNEDNLRHAQELVLLVNSKVEQKKLNTDNLNILTETVVKNITASATVTPKVEEDKKILLEEELPSD
ncbi:MAG: hypothetical protein LBV55_00560 [Acholeplasmatales bacterium]|nr:hypothetical protein [Acholeplasmatales bacterium]